MVPSLLSQVTRKCEMTKKTAENILVYEYTVRFFCLCKSEDKSLHIWATIHESINQLLCL